MLITLYNIEWYIPSDEVNTPELPSDVNLTDFIVPEGCRWSSSQTEALNSILMEKYGHAPMSFCYKIPDGRELEVCHRNWTLSDSAKNSKEKDKHAKEIVTKATVGVI